MCDKGLLLIIIRVWLTPNICTSNQNSFYSNVLHKANILIHCQCCTTKFAASNNSYLVAFHVLCFSYGQQ